jgi:hypothetical protein
MERKMSAVQTTDANTNIAAVVFLGMNDKMELVMKGDEPKPYFYLNIVGAVDQDLCLVNAPSGWALVKVLRIIPVDNIVALGKVTKALLCRVTEYDPIKIADAGRRLLEFQLRTSEQRMQKEIDKALMDDIDISVEIARERVKGRAEARRALHDYKRSFDPSDDEI